MGLALFGCKGEGPSEKGTAPAAATPEPALPDVSASLVLDGESVREIRSADVKTPVPLASLLPEGTVPQSEWLTVWFQSGKRHISYQRDLLAKGEARVYLQEGSITLGLFQEIPEDAPPHVKKRMAEPVRSMSELQSIKVTTKLKAPESTAEATTLTIQLAEGRMVEVESESLIELCAPPRKSEGKEKRQLTDCLLGKLLAKLSRAKDKKLETLILRGGGKELSLPVASVLSGQFRDVLKFNKQKQWVFRRFNDETPKALEELRGLEGIELR